MYRDAREELMQPGHLPIFGAKIVPPLADTVGLVNSDGPNLFRLIEKANEPLQTESFGRSEHQRRSACTDIRDGLGFLLL